MMCISGPPWLPGKTLRLIALARSSSLVRINPPRGPRRVLCVVVVTTWACGNGDGCAPADDQPGDVRDVRHQQRADFVGDLAELREVDRPRIRAVAAHDHLRLQLLRLGADGVEVDRLGLRVQLVMVRLVEDRRRVELHPVRQVPAAGEVDAR